MRRKRVLALIVGAALPVALVGGELVARGSDGSLPVLATVAVGPRPNTIAVDERSNHVFISDSTDITIRMLDGGDGRVLRTISLDGAPGPMAVDTWTSRLFVVTQPPTGPSHVMVLDTHSGLPRRAVPAGQGASALAIDRRTGRVFVVDSSGNTVRMLDATSGMALRITPVGWAPQAPAVDERDGRVFVANNSSGTVSMLDAYSGRLLRTIAVGPEPGAINVDERTGHVFVETQNANAILLDARSGWVLGAITTAGIASMLIDKRTGHGFIPYANRLAMVDARTGTIQRSVPLSDRWLQSWFIFSSMVLDDRARRVLTLSGCRSENYSAAHSSNGALPGALTDAGCIYVLDSTTADIVRIIPVGLDPDAIALDPRSGHVFVLDTNKPAFPGLSSNGSGNASDGWSWMPSWLRSMLPFLPQQSTIPKTGTVSVVDTTR